VAVRDTGRVALAGLVSGEDGMVLPHSATSRQPSTVDLFRVGSCDFAHRQMCESSRRSGCGIRSNSRASTINGAYRIL
jgi:hypothetical protein